MDILVTGGTGSLGREVVRAAVAAGHQVCVTSRHPSPEGVGGTVRWARVDLATGVGLCESLAGIDVVVHAASDPNRADSVDVKGMQRLVEAAQDARIQHVIYVSIVGIDRIPVRYYQQKLAAERLLTASRLPYSILRATQFHGFIDVLLGKLSHTPLVFPVPLGFQVQSVSTEDVANRLLRALSAGPGGHLADFGGPEVMDLSDAVRVWKVKRSVRKPILSIPVPGRAAAAFRAGYNTADNSDRGTVTWAQWLESRSTSSSAHLARALDE